MSGFGIPFKRPAGSDGVDALFASRSFSEHVAPVRLQRTMLAEHPSASMQMHTYSPETSTSMTSSINLSPSSLLR